MKLFCYKNQFGITYTNTEQKIGQLIQIVDAEYTTEPITNEYVIFANIGIFKVKMKIKRCQGSN